MRQPNGCEDETGWVCRLIDTLYGLKKSGREWNKIRKEYLIERAGHQQLINENGNYFRSDNDGYEIIAIRVDDFLINSTCISQLENIKQEIKNK